MIELDIGYVKIKLFLDIWGVNAVIDNYLQYDIINYGDFCYTTSWALDVARVQTYFEVDVNECLIGIVGTVFGQPNSCIWNTYYINHPLNTWDIYNYNLGGYLAPGTCDSTQTPAPFDSSTVAD